MWNELHDIITVVPYSDIRKGHDFLVDVLGFESGGATGWAFDRATR